MKLSFDLILELEIIMKDSISRIQEEIKTYDVDSDSQYLKLVLKRKLKDHNRILEHVTNEINPLSEVEK